MCVYVYISSHLLWVRAHTHSCWQEEERGGRSSRRGNFCGDFLYFIVSFKGSFCKKRRIILRSLLIVATPYHVSQSVTLPHHVFAQEPWLPGESWLFCKRLPFSRKQSFVFFRCWVMGQGVVGQGVMGQGVMGQGVVGLIALVQNVTAVIFREWVRELGMTHCSWRERDFPLTHPKGSPLTQKGLCPPERVHTRPKRSTHSPKRVHARTWFPVVFREWVRELWMTHWVCEVCEPWLSALDASEPTHELNESRLSSWMVYDALNECVCEPWLSALDVSDTTHELNKVSTLNVCWAHV